MKLYFRVALNLLLVMAAMMVTRWVFFLENAGQFTHSAQAYRLMFQGGVKFDLAAVMYANALWLLMVFFPLRVKERPGIWAVEKWVFVVLNSVLLLANFCDTVFYSYRQSRTTAEIFSEFGGDSNLGGIVFNEILSHWYLVLLFVGLTFGLYKLYVRPVAPRKGYYWWTSAGLALSVFCFISGVRGSLPSPYQRPMSVNFAQRYAVSPRDAAVVLNTPFAIIRTLGHKASLMPPFYASEKEMLGVYSPIHPAFSQSGPLNGKNIVIMILESFSREFSGLMNPGFESYTPCLDSIMALSTRFENSFSNSGFSIDAMPSVFASIPRMEKSFVTSLYSQNQLDALPKLLDDEGYYTAFFHGADNMSLGFQAFARQAGFKNYYGLDEYCSDPKTGGMKDFDGSWGIWDEEFLQYFARQLSEFSQPFLAGVFTLSSHHPFVVPDRYRERFPQEKELALLHTLRYADMALGRFFQSAAKEPWFENTVFVITADHTFLHPSLHKEFNTDVGYAKIPIFFYDPTGEVFPPQVLPGVMQQIDIMPTLLCFMGYQKPFFAFGKNALDPAARPWAVKWTSSVCEIMTDSLVLQLNTDSWQPSALYDYKNDPLLDENLLGDYRQANLDSLFRAIIQTFQTYEAANRVSAATLDLNKNVTEK